MKNSEIYKLAQYAVLRDEVFTKDEKLEILKVLMEKEAFERFLESEEAK